MKSGKPDYGFWPLVKICVNKEANTYANACANASAFKKSFGERSSQITTVYITMKKAEFVLFKKRWSASTEALRSLGKQKHPTKSNLNWVLGGSPSLKLR